MANPKEPVPQDCGIATIMTPGATGGCDNVDGGKSAAADGVTSITAAFGDVTRLSKSVKYVIK